MKLYPQQLVPVSMQLNNFAPRWTLTGTVVTLNVLKLITCQLGLPCHH